MNAPRCSGSLPLPPPLLLLLLLLSATTSLALAHDARWHPCVEVKRDLRVPCRCAITVSGLNRTTLALELDCDRMILSDDALANLEGQPIISFSQRGCGHQELPASTLAVLPDGLEKLDLGGNLIHRVMDRKLQGRTSLRELRLASNALGDSLNPIFSSYEFHELSGLRLLDLRDNGIRSIEEGILKGCSQLDELYLDGNSLRQPPIDSLKGPAALKTLGLAGNDIATIQRGAFSPLAAHLQRLDVSGNELSHLEDGAFSGMAALSFLNLSNNELQHLNSDVLKGAYNLKQLDISSNFLEQFPTEALRHQRILQSLNFSNNLITELERAHLTSVRSVEVLDLSRNNIGRLGVNTFTDLASLVRLDLSLNALRAIEESAFEGLLNLKRLSLQDNNILLVPSAALARLPALVNLQLDYNRIAVLSSELVHASAPRLITFSLTHNLVRELPARLFAHFDKLLSINLSDNMIPHINPQTFVGVEDTLIHLDLSYNRLAAVGEIPLRWLQSLNLAGNHLKKVAPETFKHLNRLLHLNISDNPLYGGFPPLFPRSLLSLDVSRTGLQILPPVLLLNLLNLERISLSGNRLRKIGENTFKHLFNLTSIDLSYNQIEEIETEAFVGLINLYSLNLRRNKLRVFAGEYFNTGTGLEYLDLSHNQLEHLTPTSFLIHPRLKQVNLAGNRFSTFPSEFVKNLQFIEYLNLSDNRISSIGEFGFAQIARLRELDLSGNRIETVDELAFHNSTQLQQLDLSRNRLESLSERMLEGVLRLEKIDLMNNRLNSLPDKIFDTSRIRSLESVDISGNKFIEIPTEALRKQMSNLLSLNVARNRLSEVFNQDIIDTVKELDLSENPLSENSSFRILSEAKVLRSLNMASCGIHRISKVEAPFLRRLDLSRNNLDVIESSAFERTTMLEELNVSKNKLPTVSMIANAFGTPPMLKSLDISSNDIKAINESSLHGFETLKELKIVDLENCTRIEKNAFKSMTKLRRLEAHNYPRLGYFDVQGITKGMNSLKVLDIEIKDLNAGNEQLSVRMHPRLRSLSLRGDRLNNVLSSLLVGIKAQQLSLGLKNTSIEAIPSTLLFPVPRSTKIELNVAGSKLKTIPQQLAAVFEERNNAFQMKGLDIQIKCDCSVKYLWRWSKNAASASDNSIECTAPESLKNQSLNDLLEDQLSCEPEKTTVFQTEHTEATTNARRPSTSMEPEIIWTVASATQSSRHPQSNNGDNFMNVSIGSINGTDDTLIIGIVGGVVAFIAIVVIIICICRLRWSNQMNEAQMHATMAPSIHEASMLRPASVYSGKINQDLYVGSYNGSTLGHSKNNAGISLPATPVQMLPFVQPVPMIQPSAAGQPIYGYYDGSGMPIYITTACETKQER
ncbi:protein artichoke [Phymastichus coffea]|uniref:protein artichoke n=1 Tax=Phymastichus coffea TaxID=108790 RepID=UPI00273A9B72|nr:protein artichoke [Phymastichus coffea]